MNTSVKNWSISKKSRPYQICNNCVMDASDAEISFDQNGMCDHCTTYYKDIEPFWRGGVGHEDELAQLTESIKKEGQSKDFDCIIGMSGGCDSSYLLYVATKILGLRPLVFHVDAGWNSQIAVNNIERLVDGLGLDLFTEVIDWQEMQDLQLSFFRSGVPHIDTPQDHAFFATMYKFANRYNIKNIMTGANFSTECIRNPLEWMYFQSDSRQIKDIHRKFGSRQLNSFPLTSILWHKLWLPYVRGIKVHKPLNLIEYNKSDAMDVLANQFGWQPYPQKHFESRFTKFYESYWLPTRFGYDVRKVQFSSLILTGQMTREEALQELRNPSYDPSTIDQEIEFVANKLDISVNELMGYMELPKKSFRDYKNQKVVYDLGAKAMRMIGLERGGKR